MTASIGEQIMEAMAAALGPTVNGAPVYRSRTDPISRAQTPAILLQPVGGPIDQPVIPKLQWVKVVHLMIYVRGAVPDQLADGYKVAANSLLMADMSLGGLALQIIPKSEHFQLSDADTESCVLTIEYEIQYRTDQVNLTIQ